MYYALDLGKDFLAVHLSDTKLPPGLHLSISAIQAILKHQMSLQNYWRKLEKALPATLREARVVPPAPAPPPPPPRAQPETEAVRIAPSAKSADAPTVPPIRPGLVSTLTGWLKKPSPGAGGPWTNSLGMKFVPVPGTEVLFGIWEVRVQDYRAYAEANQGVDVSWKQPGFPQGDTHPVVKVNWDDAKAFCAWLSRKEGKAYRLPADTEWSVAVGLPREVGNTPQDKGLKIKEVFPWGNQWPPPKGAGNYSPRLQVDDFEYTSPVGSFAANPFGLYDLGGNVWEWCEDWYDGEQKYRVLRGGSWSHYGPDMLLSSSRNYYTPDLRYDYFGFRCMLVDGSSR